MTITSFDNLKDSDIVEEFGYTIAKRGESYFREGLVTNVVKVTDNKYTAEVEGSKKYKVEVEIKNNNLVLHCTCAYNHLCKHEAALLYYIIEQCSSVEKTETFVKLARKMNGILIINKTNLTKFFNALNDEIKESRKLETKERINYLFDLLKTLKYFTIKVENEKVKKIILSEFENVDYNSQFFYNKMVELKEDSNFYTMLEIVPYLEKDKITNKLLLEFFSKCAFLLESYYGNVKSSQALGIYNFNFNETEYKKIVTNKYKVGEYIKGLYINKRYNEIEQIYFAQTNLVFNSIFYYILSSNDTSSHTLFELIDSMETTADYNKLLTLQSSFNNDVYLYLFDHYDGIKVLKLLKDNNKMGLLIENVDMNSFKVIDDLYDELKEQYNNKLLFAYQKIIYYQLHKTINSSVESFNKNLKRLYNLKNGKYVLFLLYKHISSQYYNYDYNLKIAFKNFMVQNNILTTVI